MAAVSGPSTTSHDFGNADLYGGIVLCVATVAALVVANSPLGAPYSALLIRHASVLVAPGRRRLTMSWGSVMSDLAEVDRVALELCLAQTLAEPDRTKQIESMLADDPRFEVAHFACYHQQMQNLRLSPWHFPPCWISPARIDELIKLPRHGDVQSKRAAAVLAKRLIDAGLSQFEPDPMGAIEAVEAVR